MKKTAWAKIAWIPADKGGRRQPWHGKRYSTVARFTSPEVDCDSCEWSIVFEPSPSTLTPKTTMKGQLQLLAPDAPQSLLHEGSEFELLEGRRLVARGRIGREEAGDPPNVGSTLPSWHCITRVKPQTWKVKNKWRTDKTSSKTALTTTS